MPPRKCSHTSITYTSSPHAAEVEYKQPTLKERKEATEPAASSKLSKPPTRSDAGSFPAPLVLPGDDLAEDPEYPPQSFQEWYDEEERNHVTPRKRTIYIVGPPEFDSDSSTVKSWTNPTDSSSQPLISKPVAEDVMSYVSAFYHGLPTKCFQLPNWSFCSWDDEEEDKKKKTKKSTKKTLSIGLKAKNECIRIRARVCPDRTYPYQLNLDDLLDVAISILPDDAYALCMLVDHDLYESADDIFVCGRAYGGSRVAVVSTARYNPNLDEAQGVERQHAWPASHCTLYMERTYRESSNGISKRQKKLPRPYTDENTPLGFALGAVSFCNRKIDGCEQRLLGLWLARMCRTVSHELGHCFGIDHCTYYACIMQGSASLSEDVRQPPYLCPVDLAKVLHATGTTAQARYRALLAYCNRDNVNEVAHFAGFAAWLRRSLLSEAFDFWDATPIE